MDVNSYLVERLTLDRLTEAREMAARGRLARGARHPLLGRAAAALTRYRRGLFRGDERRPALEPAGVSSARWTDSRSKPGAASGGASGLAPSRRPGIGRFCAPMPSLTGTTTPASTSRGPSSCSTR